MNERMWINEDKAKSCNILSRQMNEHLNLYRKKISDFTKSYRELEDAKFEMLYDSINKMIIFETACDMNNKYDTKGFSQLMEKIDKSKYMDKIKLKEFENTGKYTFITKDEIRDRVKISEMDQILFKMTAAQRSKSLVKTRQFFQDTIDNLWDAKSEEQAQFMDINRIIGETDSLPGRDILVNVIASQSLKTDQGNYIIPNEHVYDSICDMIFIVLNSAHKHKDPKTMLDIIKISNAFYRVNKKPGLSPYIYLQEGIKNHKIWEDQQCWELLLLLKIRGEMKSTVDIDDKSEREILKKDNVFSQLESTHSDILSFGVAPELVKDLINKFCEGFNLSEENIAKIRVLMIKVDCFGKSKSEIYELQAQHKHIELQRSDEKKRQSRGSWLGAFGMGRFWNDKNADLKQSNASNLMNMRTSPKVTPTKGEDDDLDMQIQFESDKVEIVEIINHELSAEEIVMLKEQNIYRSPDKSEPTPEKNEKDEQDHVDSDEEAKQNKYPLEVTPIKGSEIPKSGKPDNKQIEQKSRKNSESRSSKGEQRNEEETEV